MWVGSDTPRPLRLLILSGPLYTASSPTSTLMSVTMAGGRTSSMYVCDGDARPRLNYMRSSYEIFYINKN